MKKIFKLSTLFILSISLVSCGSKGGSTETSDGYSITWKDYNGSILKKETSVKEGTIPEYSGIAPYKPSDEQYYYVFDKWNPDLAPVTSDQTYVASYVANLISAKAIFDLDGGESSSFVPYRMIDAYRKEYFFFDVTKAGFNFRGWSFNGILVFDNKGNLLCEPELEETMTFKAVFSNKSEISVIQNYEDAAVISGLGEYTPGTYANLKVEANEGYVFEGWYKNGVLYSLEPEIKYLMGSSDETLEAKFKYGTYSLTVESYDSYYGKVKIQYTDESYEGTNTEELEFNSYVVVDVITLTSHKFIGWYTQDGELVSEESRFSFRMPGHDYKLIAKWDYFKLTLVNSMPAAGTITYSGYRVCDTEVKIVATLNKGYTFVGWFNEDDSLFSDKAETTFIMPRKPLTLTAKFTANTNHLTVLSEDNDKGTVEGGGFYLTGESVTISALPCDDSIELYKKYVFDGWYKVDGSLFSDEQSFTFLMPGEDFTLIAKFVLMNKETNDIVRFGRYPQSKVSDSKTLTMLKAYEGYLKEENEQYVRQPYNWFFDLTNEVTFAWYLDLDIDFDGLNDYRGVYFTQYREGESNELSYIPAEESHQYMRGYYKNNVYWFNYEPIEWRVLKGEKDDLFIFSQEIIDAERVSLKDYEGNIYDVDFSKYIPNNYKTSYIRSYLNNHIYNTAFSNAEKLQVKTTLVDNSAQAGGYNSNPFACEDTNDKLFLLSRVEACNSEYGFDLIGESDPFRIKMPTDYAGCLGCECFSGTTLNGSCHWWLRTPVTNGPVTTHMVRDNGTCNPTINPEYTIDCFDWFYSIDGVVPAAHISI